MNGSSLLRCVRTVVTDPRAVRAHLRHGEPAAGAGGWLVSVSLMAKVWDSSLPSEEKFVALALADWADDDGTRIYPSQAVVARKVGKDARSVRRSFKKLIDRGVLVPVAGQGGGRGVTVHYRMDATALPKADETSTYQGVNPDTDAPIPGRFGTETRTPASDDPSSDPPVDPSDQSFIHARVVPISSMRSQKTSEVADIYARLVEAGIQRPPSRWAEDWLARGRTVEDLRRAIQQMSEHARTPGTAYVNKVLEGMDGASDASAVGGGGEGGTGARANPWTPRRRNLVAVGQGNGSRSEYADVF